MKKVLMAVFIIAALLGVIFYLKTSHTSVHHHAGFQIYIDGKLQNFEAAKFMSLVPCGDDGQPTETHDRVHLHDSIGNMVHVHQPAAVWGDLLSYIKLDPNKYGNVKGYINDNEVSNILEEEIHPYDSVVLLLGTYKNEDINTLLKDRLSKEYIQQTESKTGLCSG